MYYVIASDGQRYGPVDLATLNQWTADSRVVPTTILEGTDGQRVEASQLPGIVFPAAAAPTYGAPMGGPGMGAPGMGAPGMGAPGGYGAPGTNASGYAPYPHQQAYGFGDNGQKDVTISFIFTGINLLIGWACCPILFGVISIVYGNKAKQKGHPQGQMAFIAAIVVLVLAMGIGFATGIGSALAGMRGGSGIR